MQAFCKNAFKWTAAGRYCEANIVLSSFIVVFVFVFVFVVLVVPRIDG